MTMTNAKQYRLLSTIRGLIVLGIVASFTALVSVSDAGIGRTGIIAVGRITQFGSIFVNKREYTIDAGTAITVDGQPATEAELRLGQRVFVRGLQDDENPVGLARTIIFADNVEGPIAAINRDDDQLVVLDQLVMTDASTVIETLSGANSLDDLFEGDQIEVSGFLTATGDIVASRIQQKPGGSFEVTGVVSDLMASTFAINSLTIDFSTAVLVDSQGAPLGSIAEGDTIEAHGAVFGANGEMIALRVQLQQAIAIAGGEKGEFEGLITHFESTSSFSLGATPVLTSNSTVFVGGGPGNLAANTSIEVFGQFTDDGILAAGQVTIRGTRIRIHAPVDSVTANSLTTLGIAATVDSSTRITDQTSARLEPFMLSDLYPADYIEIRSFKNPAVTTPFLAERAIREDSETDVRLQGFVGSLSTQQFDVHGVNIEVDQDTSYANANGEEISASDFFAVLTVGTFVKIQGAELSTTVLLAESIELELDD